MNKSGIGIILILFAGLYATAGVDKPDYIKAQGAGNSFNNRIDSLYGLIKPLDTRPSIKVFRYGLKGYDQISKEGKIKNLRYISLIDFSLSSTQKRLWVIDLDSMKIIQNSLVAHGKNTGEEYAVKFSNTPKSNMSSLGFYITGASYNGKHGLSLYLEGVEQGINDNARTRAIVIHPADYVTKDFILRYGRLGRSFGCPALPPAKSDAIINTIKGGSCLFIYFPDDNYKNHSKYISGE